MRITRIKVAVVLAFVAVAVVFVFALRRTSLGEVARRQASPGRLSAAHSFTENNCAACHTPFRGVEAANCVVCHANNEELLARQPTAFHAHISSCSECHLEHQGAERRPVGMDHLALARIGLRQLNEGDAGSEQRQKRAELLVWMRQYGAGWQATASQPNVTPEEATLNCAGCHDTRDKHVGLFGKDCAQCHATTQWTIPEFIHPTPRSTNCAQCHQAPPSHYMEHFEMVSKRVAGVRDAAVSQCYLCHQTTSWNDIKGIGWYKHH